MLLNFALEKLIDLNQDKSGKNFEIWLFQKLNDSFIKNI